MAFKTSIDRQRHQAVYDVGWRVVVRALMGVLGVPSIASGGLPSSPISMPRYIPGFRKVRLGIRAPASDTKFLHSTSSVTKPEHRTLIWSTTNVSAL